MEITKDYARFKFISSNRPIDKCHVKKLMKSIEDKNMLQQYPIKVNSDYYIIDGQHRLKACEALGIEVPFEKVDDDYESYIIPLNSNSKNWTNKDYLEYHISKDRYTYVKMKELMVEYDVGLGVILPLSIKTNRTKGIYNSFKEGTFKIENVEFLEETLKEIQSFSKYFTNWRDRNFIDAYKMVKLNEKFSYRLLIHKVETFPSLWYRCVSRKAYLQMIENIYNYQQKYKTRLY